MSKKAQTQTQRVLTGLAASSGSFAVAFSAARDLGAIPVLLSLVAAGAIIGGAFLVRGMIKTAQSTTADDQSAVAETLASL